MEVQLGDVAPIEGSTHEVPIPQAVSTHAVGAWPEFKLAQSSSYKSDLTKTTHTVAGVRLVVYTEEGGRNNLPYYLDELYSPDSKIESLFSAMEKVCVIHYDATNHVVERENRLYKFKQYGMDTFEPPPSTDPVWRHRNYERLIQSLSDFSISREDLPNVNPGGMVDWGGPDNRPNLSRFVATDYDNPQYPEFDGTGYTYGPNRVGPISKQALGNRFTTALVVDTPRKTSALWNVFALINSGYHWYKRPNQLVNSYRNIVTPLQARANYEVFNSFVAKIPMYVKKIEPQMVNACDSSTDGLGDELTYNPIMIDIGATILNVSSEVSNHVSASMKALVKMESVSYIEVSALIMSLSRVSSSKASTFGAFTASLNNAAASSAFSPVIESLSCAFTAIELDIPTNARQGTILTVVALMTYPSRIYTNQTKALIHNMFVGMVMPTNSNAYTNPMRESGVDFGHIRRLSSAGMLLPTPPPDRITNRRPNPLHQATRDAMLHLLCHFHGIKCEGLNDDMGNSANMSITGSLVDQNPPESKSYYQHYKDQFGTIPINTLSRETYLYDPTNSSPPIRGTRYDTIVASTFETFTDNVTPFAFTTEGEAPVDLAEDGVRAINEDDNAAFFAKTVNCKVHGMFAILHSVVTVEGKQKGLVTLTEPWKDNFSDDIPPLHESEGHTIRTRYLATPGKELQSYESPSSKVDEALGIDDISFHINANSRDYYVVPAEDVRIITNIRTGPDKMRPRHFGVLPVNHATKISGVMEPVLRDFVSKSIMPIISGIQTVESSNYASEMATMMFNHRWASFCEYLSMASKVTGLCDYCPFSYNPMIVPASHKVDLSNPTAYRGENEYVRDHKLMESTPASPQYPTYVTLFPGTAGYDVNDAHVKYEDAPMQRVIVLEPSSIVALTLLGVAPNDPPDLSGSLPLNLDSKSFNHDVTMMRIAARIIKKEYVDSDYSAKNRYEALKPETKMQKFTHLLSKIRSMFPVVSPMTAMVERSLTQYHLRQNHIWRDSPFIDASFDQAFNDQFDYMQSYQYPFLRSRPIIPLNDTNSKAYKCPGLQDTLFDQLMTLTLPYVDHSLSHSHLFTDVAKLDSARIEQGYALTRVVNGPVPVPTGVPYVSPLYFASPMVICMWNYEYAYNAVRLYDMHDAYAGRQEINGVTLPGVSTYRDQRRVLSDFLYFLRRDLAETKPSVVYRNPHGMRINWKKASSLLDANYDVPMPNIIEDSEAIPIVDAMYTTPEMYVSKSQEILDRTGVASGVMPILHKNQGPFISRLAARNWSWPDNSDYTVDGALTENVQSDNVGERDGESCEYNTNMIGVIPTRINAIKMINPTDMLVLVRDPLALWFKQ